MNAWRYARLAAFALMSGLVGFEAAAQSDPLMPIILDFEKASERLAQQTDAGSTVFTTNINLNAGDELSIRMDGKVSISNDRLAPDRFTVFDADGGSQSAAQNAPLPGGRAYALLCRVTPRPDVLERGTPWIYCGRNAYGVVQTGGTLQFTLNAYDQRGFSGSMLAAVSVNGALVNAFTTPDHWIGPRVSAGSAERIPIEALASDGTIAFARLKYLGYPWNDVTQEEWAETTENLQAFTQSLEACPCTLGWVERYANRGWRKTPDHEFLFSKPFHPDAENEARWTAPGRNSGQQCTYGWGDPRMAHLPERDMPLITHGPSAGTPDFFSPEPGLDWLSNINSHRALDVSLFNKLPVGAYLHVSRPNNGNSCAKNPQNDRAFGNISFD